MTEREQALARIAAAVAQLLGMPELAFDDDDCISLEFDDITCTLLATDEHLILHAELARRSLLADSTELCRALLGMNADLAFADGVAALATDQEADSIALSCVIRPLYAAEAAPVETLMEQYLGRFLELAKDLQLRLQQFATPSRETSRDPGGGALRV